MPGAGRGPGLTSSDTRNLRSSATTFCLKFCCCERDDRRVRQVGPPPDTGAGSTSAAETHCDTMNLGVLLKCTEGQCPKHAHHAWADSKGPGRGPTWSKHAAGSRPLPEAPLSRWTQVGRGGESSGLAALSHPRWGGQPYKRRPTLPLLPTHCCGDSGAQHTGTSPGHPALPAEEAGACARGHHPGLSWPPTA